MPLLSAVAPAETPLSLFDRNVILTVAPAVCGVLVGVMSLLGLVFRVANRTTRDRADRAERQVAELMRQIAAGQIGGAEDKIAALEVELAAATDERDKLGGEVAELRAGHADVTTALDAEKRRVRNALKRDGMVWSDKVLATAPDFKLLDPAGRRMPVVSVLNLKGGVGKTTSVANLAAALAGRGYRVLLVDLDLQGSLTGMFLPDDGQQTLADDGRLVQDFLTKSVDGEFPNVLDHAADILPGTKSMIVPATDQLAYAEMNMTVRWFLKDCKDPRFLPRRGLHLKRVTDRFDIVLIDCLPLINVSCVNALAASDYVLIPVMPSKQSTDRVTILLRRLREFKMNAVNPSLMVLGFFANRTNGRELSLNEENRLSALSDKCLDTWGQKVHRFKAFVRQNVSVRAAEDSQRPIGPGDEMFPAYQALAAEVEEQFPMFCRPAKPAGVTAGTAVTA